MSHKSRKEITDSDIRRVFLEPANPTHRQYEALRAYFLEGIPSAEAAARFGYTPGSFRVLCHGFRQDLPRPFFLPVTKGPHVSTKRNTTREKIIELRKQNLSIYDISRTLQEEDRRLSPAAVARVLKEAGFAKLPRRADEERPATPRPEAAAVADVRQLDLSPQQFRTQFGGLFLFVPYLVQIPLERMLQQTGFPGTQQVPAAQAMRSLLALKLFGSARRSHVMSSVFDQGLALFAGLNVTPKRSFLTEYSCRIPPAAYPKLMSRWFDALKSLDFQHGVSFDVDFHSIPSHGEDALLQKHYISKRRRRQKGLLAFLAQDADKRVFCYVNATVRKENQSDEILRFVEYWKQRTGHLPEELVFDSKLTTYRNLNRLHELGIPFITLRDYDGPIRQIAVTDLGHEEPTSVVTSQPARSAVHLIGRYAQRMLIENGIADGVDFFHMDALSSAVAMKVSCDLQLTLMASSLYRLLGEKIGNGYATAKSQHIFRDFINAVANVMITEREIQVRFQKRAHNPLAVAAGFAQTDLPVPWLGKKRLQMVFG